MGLSLDVYDQSGVCDSLRFVPTPTVRCMEVVSNLCGTIGAV